jgi:hypothetical protein
VLVCGTSSAVIMGATQSVSTRAPPRVRWA